MIILAGGHFGFCKIMQNAQPTTNCAKWILKVDYLIISKQQKKFGVSEMQGSGTGNPTTIDGFNTDSERPRSTTSGSSEPCVGRCIF